MIKLFRCLRGEYDNVAFIYASDDMLWGREYLKDVKDLHFIGAGKNLEKEAQKVSSAADSRFFPRYQS